MSAVIATDDVPAQCVPSAPTTARCCHTAGRHCGITLGVEERGATHSHHQASHRFRRDLHVRMAELEAAGEGVLAWVRQMDETRAWGKPTRSHANCRGIGTATATP